MGAYGGYIRVSVVGDRDGERFISPSLQRDRITGWAAAHGHDLADIREDLDVSGGSRKRPQLEALIGQIESPPFAIPVASEISASFPCPWPIASSTCSRLCRPDSWLCGFGAGPAAVL